ncbi:radical SAM protein [Paenibacillus sp. M1]|uniref:Radical SAM protein n=1 Tax=Paenibacillus haidiansis TaxID=1574488 RepID=A0ABU7VQA9_9BACL
MNRILLLFPPLGNHEHPHLGLPILKGYLAEHGYDSCEIRDYNVVIMDRITRELMTEDSGSFSQSGGNVIQNYDLARNIMKGNSFSDKLKSGWAMDLIGRYLKTVGLYIVNHNIGFDPTSFQEVEKEFQRVDPPTDNNRIIRYIYDEVIPDIAEYNPNVIGISIVFASQVLYSILICRLIKELYPHIKIVLGGAQPTLFWTAFLNSDVFSPYFDGIIREQGEIAFVALLDYWTKGIGKLEDIPNFTYRTDDGLHKVHNVIKSEDMNNIPTPDFRDLPMDLYAYPKLPYQMSRGCYWGLCAFCGYRGCATEYMIASKEKITRDLSILKQRHGIRIFHLMDDAIPPDKMLETAKFIVERELDITYAAFLRAEKGFTKEICDVLYKSGLRGVLFGIESANSRLLKLMDKGLSIRTMKEVLANFSAAGITNYLSIIIGFPTEEREEAMETLDFLKNNKDIYFKAYLTPFRLFTGMTEETEKYEISNVNLNNPVRHDDTGYVSFEYTYTPHKGMQIQEFIEVLREGRKLVDSLPPGPIYFR